MYCRGVALLDAEQRIRDAVIKLEVAKGHLAAEQLEWQSRLEEVEASWRCKALFLKFMIVSQLGQVVGYVVGNYWSSLGLAKGDLLPVF